MVVVLVVIARAATPAGAADAMFRANGRAANIVGIVADAALRMLRLGGGSSPAGACLEVEGLEDAWTMRAG